MAGERAAVMSSLSVGPFLLPSYSLPFCSVSPRASAVHLGVSLQHQPHHEDGTAAQSSNTQSQTLQGILLQQVKGSAVALICCSLRVECFSLQYQAMLCYMECSFWIRLLVNMFLLIGGLGSVWFSMANQWQSGF